MDQALEIIQENWGKIMAGVVGFFTLVGAYYKGRREGINKANEIIDKSEIMVRDSIIRNMKGRSKAREKIHRKYRLNDPTPDRGPYDYNPSNRRMPGPEPKD